MSLSARLTTPPELDPPARDEMFALMDRHYANVQRAVFDDDLAEKRWVILVHEPGGGRLCGFSTQTLLRGVTAGREVRVLFSGDTIIDRERWGDPALSHVWGRLALALIDHYAGEELYWLLLSQGFRTYRFLPLFFHEFYPRPQAQTPWWSKQLIDLFAGQRYADAYDAAAGVVRATARQYRLRSGLGDLTQERLRDRHVEFFAAANPGHRQGDELCCLAPLSRENFTKAAYRVIGPEGALVELS